MAYFFGTSSYLILLNIGSCCIKSLATCSKFSISTSLPVGGSSKKLRVSYNKGVY